VTLALGPEFEKPPAIPASRRDWARFAAELPNYWNREEVPSVSQIIGWKWPMPDFPAVYVAADRGHKFHATAEFDDQGNLDEESIAGTDLEGYLAGWRQYLKSLPRFDWIGIECPLWGEIVGVPYVVRPDRVLIEKATGLVSVVEIKTRNRGARMPAKDQQWQHALQLAAQAIAVAQRLDVKVTFRTCVYLWPDQEPVKRHYGETSLDGWGKLVAEWKDSREDW
jgi:hypothetical protein